MGVEQHFVPLARVGNEPEGPTSAELEVGDLHAAVDATDHQPLFTSVKLKGFAHFELERNEGVRGFAFFAAPGTNEVGDLAIAARVTVDLYLRKQGFGGAPVLFGAVGTSL